MPDRPSVAITGACGRIGRALVELLAAHGYPLTLIDRPGAPGLGPRDVVGLDLAEPLPAQVLADVDVVVHLAADPDQDASWESLLPNNIQASYNVAHAAMLAGCRRLIVASSIHAVMASAHRPVRPSDAVAPSDLYGVTKCFAEALAFWCAHRGPMSAAAVRIGAFQPVHATRQPGAERMADVFIAAPDLASLLERAITAEYRFALLHAVGPGHHELLDMRATEDLLGWRAEHPFPGGASA